MANIKCVIKNLLQIIKVALWIELWMKIAFKVTAAVALRVNKDYELI